MNNSTNRIAVVPRAQAIAWCATFILEALVIILGNAITIAIFSTKKHKKQRSFLLMINLAVADALIGAFPLPLYVYYIGKYPFYLWTPPQIKALNFVFYGLDIVLGFASLLTLMAISVERYLAASYPVTYRALRDRAYIIAIVSIWFVALTTGIFCVASTNLNRLIATYVSMTLVSALCLIICVSYIKIWVGLRRRRKQIRKRSKEVDGKLVVTLFIVTFCSLAAWLPFVCVNFYYSFSQTYPKEEFLLFSKLLHYGNSLLNPVIYSFRVPGFRKSAKRILSFSNQRSPGRDRNKDDSAHSPTIDLEGPRTVQEKSSFPNTSHAQ